MSACDKCSQRFIHTFRSTVNMWCFEPGYFSITVMRLYIITEHNNLCPKKPVVNCCQSLKAILIIILTQLIKLIQYTDFKAFTTKWITDLFVMNWPYLKGSYITINCNTTLMTPATAVSLMLMQLTTEIQNKSKKNNIFRISNFSH